MQVSSNDVIMQDNMVYGSKVTDSFIETKINYNVVQELNSNEGNRNSFIGVYVQMDDSKKLIQRTTATFTQASSNSGGFMSVIYLITLFFIKKLQSTIYFTSLIKSFYQY